MITQEVLSALLTLRSVRRMYADDHDRTEAAVGGLALHLRATGVDLRIDVAAETLSMNDEPVVGASRSRNRLADVLRQLGVANLVVRCDAPGDDLAQLGTLLGMKPAVLIPNRDTVAIPSSISITWAQDPGGDEEQPDDDGADQSVRSEHPPRPSGAREEDYPAEVHSEDPDEEGDPETEPHSGTDWVSLATEALRRRITRHDPPCARFLVLCDLFLRAPSVADRVLRRSLVSDAVRSESFSVDQLCVAFEALADRPEPRHEILIAALCNAEPELVCRFADAVDPSDAHVFLAACAEREDATELLLQLAQQLGSPEWRAEFARVLGARARDEPDVIAQLLAAGDAGRELMQETLAQLVDQE